MIEGSSQPAQTTVVGEFHCRGLESPRFAWDWRAALPDLHGARVSLRELRMSDAPALLAVFTAPDVARYISQPPTSLEGFERFIAWTRREQIAGAYICFAVVPDDCDTVVGLIQVRRLEPSFATAEWGFALASRYWGSDLFHQSAALVVDFVSEAVGVRRLEARAAVGNDRGNDALRKLGAVQEAILYRSFLRDGIYMDQVLWSIDTDAWLQSKSIWGPRFH